MRAATRAKIHARIIAKTRAIVVGKTYFLSSFYDKTGAFVKVLSVSTRINRCGWPSSVEVESVEPVSDTPDAFNRTFYAPGMRHTVNASNLYVTRDKAGVHAR